MLTQRGWATAGAGTALALLWFLFGEPELGVAALLLLRRRRPRLDPPGPPAGDRRQTSPSAVHDGDHASVTLHITNEGVPLRQLTITDEVAGLGTAGFATSLPRRATYKATYRVLCRPRGVYRIGPCAHRVRPTRPGVRVDPGQAASTRWSCTRRSRTWSASRCAGPEHGRQARRPRHSQRGGEDFYTLREYQQGDDLRRIHWPSSARHDRLMIRQLEIPWQARSLVVLDVRAEAYSNPAAFEVAVSGAASVIRHLMHHGFETQVWMGGPTVTVGGGDSGYAVAMERLARVRTQPGVELAAAASRLRYQGGGGMLVMATGAPDPSLLGLARVLSPEYPTAALLVAENGSGSSVGDFQRAGVTTVTFDNGSWARSWNRAMRTTWHAASAGS